MISLNLLRNFLRVYLTRDEKVFRREKNSPSAQERYENPSKEPNQQQKLENIFRSPSENT